MEKPDVNPVNALCRTPHKPGKNSNFNKRGMRNNNKTCFRCDSACSHKVKCPAESKVCNKWKQLGHCAKYCKIKLTQKSDSHKDNSRQSLHPGQTLNRITHLSSVPKGPENNFVDEVYSGNDENLLAVKDFFND